MTFCLVLKVEDNLLSFICIKDSTKLLLGYRLNQVQSTLACSDMRNRIGLVIICKASIAFYFMNWKNMNCGRSMNARPDCTTYFNDSRDNFLSLIQVTVVTTKKNERT